MSSLSPFVQYLPTNADQELIARLGSIFYQYLGMRIDDSNTYRLKYHVVREIEQMFGLWGVPCQFLEGFEVIVKLDRSDAQISFHSDDTEMNVWFGYLGIGTHKYTNNDYYLTDYDD